MVDVLIVGRSNVGKSSLFNRLVKKRQSIVFDSPGITRDVIVGQIELHGKTLTIADTGGLFNPDSWVEDFIRKNILELILDAKAVLFVVDAKTGLTQADIEVANLLRPHKEKVLLIVNKVDAKVDNKWEFYELGFEPLIEVSALHGLGIIELLDKLGQIEGGEYSRPEGSVLLILLGKPNAGKSSLANALLGKERVLVWHEPGTTRDAIEVYIGGGFSLLDTAGVRKKGSVEFGLEFFAVGRTLEALERKGVVLLVIDLSEGVSFQDKKLASLIRRRVKPALIVGTKLDLLDSEAGLEEYLKRELWFLDYAPVVLTSAKSGRGIDKILEKAKEVWADFNKQFKTSQINRALERIFSVSPPPAKGNLIPKVYYAFQQSTAPPTFVLITNETDSWREEYKRFLEKQLRKELNLEFSPIKLVFSRRNDGA
ncbi:MAG: ribosome biogenesis GTPase Der [Aquificaceae bacterium]|nr:ribosome biogenesis GTPase Der [Aquificaceae bacterium]